MLELENVLTDYVQTKAQNKLVPGKNTTVALQALRGDLLVALTKMIETAGYDVNDFHIKASAGQPNRSFAWVPWAAVFKKPMARSATKGYYIVFLFAEDMSSVSMSLNQGYTAFEERYVSRDLIHAKLQDCARAALAQLVPLPNGFDVGPVDLRAHEKLGKGYEIGSILSKTYVAGATPNTAVVQADFAELLRCYLALTARFPLSLIDLDIAVSDAQLQDAATNIALVNPGVPKTTGPQPPPPTGFIGTKLKYVRSAEVVARALAMSGGACALEEAGVPHLSFTSARTKMNYVEAHHFVPFSQQPHFAVSLDVEENIAVLCPNCHRMLHHGTQSTKKTHLKSLYRDRTAALKVRGIDVTFEQLLAMYKALDADD